MDSNKKTIIGVALGLFVVWSMACEPPVSTYRRSALTPSALGISAVAPLEDGQVELSGSVSHMDSHSQTPELGDPALHVSNVQALGQLRVGVGENWTVGGQLQGLHSAWSTPSADGTPPLVDGLGWGVGPMLSYHSDPWRGFSLGGSLALTRMSVPWASWELSEEDKETCPDVSCTGPQGQPSYELRESERDALWLYRASVGLHYRSGALGAFTGLSAQNGLSNLGFDETPRSGSTLRASDDFLVSYLGASLDLDPSLFVQGQVFFTHGHSATVFSGGLQLTLGVRL